MRLRCHEASVQAPFSHEFLAIPPPCQSIFDEDFRVDSWKSLTLGPDEFVHPTGSYSFCSSAHKKPKIAAAGPMFWWMVNSLPMGEQRLLNHRSLPGQASMSG